MRVNQIAILRVRLQNQYQTLIHLVALPRQKAKVFQIRPVLQAQYQIVFQNLAALQAYQIVYLSLHARHLQNL